MYTKSALQTDINEMGKLKVYYNGIKLNDSTKLCKLEYNLYTDGKIILWTNWYQENKIPDYFMDYKDVALNEIETDNPLYPFFFNAAVKARIRSQKSLYTRYTKKIAKLDEETKESKWYRKEAEGISEKIKELEKSLLPVDQPSPADVKAYKNFVNRRIEEKLEEERLQQEKRDAEIRKVYEMKMANKKLAEELNKKYPIAPDSYYVHLHWSEHPAIEDDTEMSLAAADIFLGRLDQQINYNRELSDFWGWYEKTKFTIRKEGEDLYTGRYDLGDGDEHDGRYGIISHIYNYGEALYNKGRNENDKESGLEMMKFAEELLAAILEPEKASA